MFIKPFLNLISISNDPEHHQRLRASLATFQSLVAICLTFLSNTLELEFRFLIADRKSELNYQLLLNPLDHDF